MEGAADHMTFEDLLTAARPDPAGPSTTVAERHRAQLDQLIERAATPAPPQTGEPSCRSGATELLATGGADPDRPVDTRGGRRTYVLALAVGVLLVGVLGTMLAGLVASSPQPAQDPDVDRSRPEHPGWYVPSALPPDWRMELATTEPGFTYLQIRHLGSGAFVRIRTGTTDDFGPSYGSVDPTRLVADDGWVAGDTGIWVRRLTGDQAQSFEAIGYGALPADTEAAIEAMLPLRPAGEDDLPLEVIDLESGPYRPVATTVFDQRVHVLGVAGPSGRFLATSISTGDEAASASHGCCLAISPPGPSIELIELWLSDRDDSLLMAGALQPDVARADLHLTDGTVLSVSPETEDHGLPVNFFLLTIPPVDGMTTSPLTLDQLDRVVTYDAAGEEMERLDEIVNR